MNGFQNGFDLHYDGPMKRQDTSNNIPLRIGNRFELWAKFMTETKAKRFAGPFDCIPFDNYVQSPVGLVPKSGNKTRLIFHLSYDFKMSGNKSVNHYTVHNYCTVKYNDLDAAVRTCLCLLSLCKQNDSGTIWFGKSDLKSAFRLLGLSPKVWWLLFMKVVNPKTGKTVYFFDKCLPFGHSISCALFQKFSNALPHIFKFTIRLKVQNEALYIALTNYLDDFLMAALTKLFCDFLLNSFLEVCQHLAVPVSVEKTEWGQAIVVFLGILLDGQRHVLAVPEEKRIKALASLQELIDKKSAIVKDLEKLTGLLNFLNKAITPGRAFTRRMYAKFATVPELKKHHHVRLDKEFKEDCRVWTCFLEAGLLAIC